MATDKSLKSGKRRRKYSSGSDGAEPDAAEAGQAPADKPTDLESAGGTVPVKSKKKNKPVVTLPDTENLDAPVAALKDDALGDISKEQECNYTVLGAEYFPPTKRLRSVPAWIDAAIVFCASLADGGIKLLASAEDLDAQLLSAVRREGVIKKWFPVQSTVLPVLLRDTVYPPILPPRDVCISAPTGSGKTLCYVLPLLQALRHRLRPTARALIVLPSHDLAAQVYAEFVRYNAFKLHIVLLSGNKSAETERKELFLTNIYGEELDGKVVCADIVVTTPGRLLDYLWADSSYTLPVDQLRYLVVDEADRMDSDARFRWFGRLEQLVTETRPRIAATSGIDALLAANAPPFQKILLSATLSSDPERLQGWNLYQPMLFRASESGLPAETTNDGTVSKCARAAVESNDGNVDRIEGALTLPSELHHFYTQCPTKHKPLCVYKLLQRHPDWKKVICFVNSKQSSLRFAKLLTYLAGEQFDVKEVSANLYARRRQKILKRFAKGTTRVLVCSDLVARGMDLACVDCVINYDMVTNERSFIHRAGRTARAGRKGTLVSIVTDEELIRLKPMLESFGLCTTEGGTDEEEETTLTDEDLQRYKSVLDSLKSDVMISRKRKK